MTAESQAWQGVATDHLLRAPPRMGAVTEEEQGEVEDKQ
jgi:hypothetical protein